MAFTGYIRTEYIFVSTNQYCFVDTSINQPLITNRYSSNALSLYGLQTTFATSTSTVLYMQNETNSGSYKGLTETVSDGPYNEYYSTDTNVPMYTCVTSGSFFDEDTDFDNHNVLWTLHSGCRVFDTPVGETAYALFRFYKVSSFETFTELFNVKVGVTTIYPFGGTSTTFSPTGTVTTSDRLAIRVYYGSEVPA